MSKWMKSFLLTVAVAGSLLLFLVLHLPNLSLDRVMDVDMERYGVFKSLVFPAPRENSSDLLTPSPNLTLSPSRNVSSPPPGQQCYPDLRVHALQRACLRHNTSRITKRFGHHFLYVNDAQKYVACLPLKAGCTTWKTILVNNTVTKPLPATFNSAGLHVNGLKPYKIYRLDSYSKERQQEILDTYYKFIVTRHPLDRLLSGHKDKILDGGFMWQRKKIIKYKLQRGLNQLNDTKQESLYDFTAFLEFILKEEYTMNPHWFPTVGLCDPCNVKYDKIVKLETQDADLMEVLPHLGPYHRSRHVQTNKHGTGAAKDTAWSRDTLHKVPHDLLHAVMQMGYDMDMDLFGYGYDYTSEALTCDYEGLGCC